MQLDAAHPRQIPVRDERDPHAGYNPLPDQLPFQLGEGGHHLRHLLVRERRDHDLAAARVRDAVREAGREVFGYNRSIEGVQAATAGTRSRSGAAAA